MTNFNTLEELHTKEELVNYFEERGQSITEEEIEALKKSYEKAEENNGALSLQQLDSVAGGIIVHALQVSSPKKERIDSRYFNSEHSFLSSNGKIIIVSIEEGKKRF